MLTVRLATMFFVSSWLILFLFLHVCCVWISLVGGLEENKEEEEDYIDCDWMCILVICFCYTWVIFVSVAVCYLSDKSNVNS